MQNVKILPHFLSKYKTTTGFNWNVLHNISYGKSAVRYNVLLTAQHPTTNYTNTHLHSWNSSDWQQIADWWLQWPRTGAVTGGRCWPRCGRLESWIGTSLSYTHLLAHWRTSLETAKEINDASANNTVFVHITFTTYRESLTYQVFQPSKYVLINCHSILSSTCFNWSTSQRFLHYACLSPVSDCINLHLAMQHTTNFHSFWVINMTLTTGSIRSAWGRGEHRQLEVHRMLGLVQNASQEITNTTRVLIMRQCVLTQRFKICQSDYRPHQDSLRTHHNSHKHLICN